MVSMLTWDGEYVDITNTTPHKGSWGLVAYQRKLALLHRDNIPTIDDPDTWCLIGGQREPGESPEVTFAREACEEIGASGKFVELGRFVMADGWRGIFAMELEDAVFSKLELGDEGQEFGFFSLAEMEHMNLSTGTQAYIEENPDVVRRFVD